MSFTTHILILASYGAAAAAAGFVLPRTLPHLDPMFCYVIAGASFLAAALLHEIFSRRLEQRDTIGQLDQAFDEIDDLRDVNRGLLADVVRSREEMAVLCEVVESAANETNHSLVREMKVLQSQLGHFGKVKTPKAANSRRKNSAANEQTGEQTPVGVDATPAAAPERPVADEEILGHIREALEANRIDLYLQPIVSLPQRRTRHYEAFSRIRTSDGRIVTPGQYLEVAKEQGLIGTIDNLLLMRCVQLLRRTEKRQNEVNFFVNISIHTLNDTGFMTQFIDFMSHNPSLATRMIFEITQRDVAALSETVWEQLGRLSELGFRFSMDQVEDLEIDFKSLAQTQFRYIKVPISLILTLPEDGADWVHPRTLKAKSSVSEISLVVERIEREADVIEVLEYGFDFGQGFLFGAPKPSREEANAA
ncbi:MAG: EAL domain-containing protein [Rhodospirillaceae bacterium]|nr:EAL domain-containing protein [Rhodospirillaceae bacterium]MBT7758378.1 EAL domain-containing protein [Rhodospirillaceae bacterium]